MGSSLAIVVLRAPLAWGLWMRYGPPHEEARLKLCLSNLKCVGLSMLQYAEEFDGRLPSAGGEDWVFQGYHYEYFHLTQPFCPHDKRAQEARWLVERELRNRHGVRDIDILRIFEELRRRGLPLTSYVMPPNIAGKRLEDLPSPATTVILEEREPWHGDKRPLCYAHGHASVIGPGSSTPASSGRGS